MKLAERGMKELAKYVDTLIIIPNQNLFKLPAKQLHSQMRSN